ncbi:hypothetical protein PanWU01x14_168830 [Parasponia andersonii]|uniref:Uncharacterized protein n=1 Tax=Parasponia andersonii TaxID=3476 RepID=A0A2P5CAP0_PARAD|nr:hypothetical protein PanWU01x14_168830 [Parasponia andersonii]
MNSDKEFYFPFRSSISTPSRFPAQSLTSDQCGSNIDSSSSELLKGFTTNSNDQDALNHDQSPSLDFMQLSDYDVDYHHQPQLGQEGGTFGFDYNVPSNVFSPQYQNHHILPAQNPLSRYPLQSNTTSLIGLKNSFLRVPNYQFASSKLHLPSLPVRIDNGLIGEKSRELDDGIFNDNGTARLELLNL